MSRRPPADLVPPDLEREEIPFDVLFVGGGPASLAGAIRLSQLVGEHNEAVERGEREGGPLQAEIGVIEKGRELGDHALSGAVLNPKGLRRLLPDFLERGCPVGREVVRDDFLFLTRRSALRVPRIVRPPRTDNRGYYTASLGRVVKWLGEQAEEAGVMILTDTSGMEVLYEDGAVAGVRTGDKGLEAGGGRKSNFQPGYDLRARVTVFGEGPRGTLAEDLTLRYDLRARCSPQSYSLGAKEVVRARPPQAGDVGEAFHTMGWPVPGYAFGGGFLYHLGEGLWSVGMVIGLDWKDPTLDVHRELQRFKSHPFVQSRIGGGEVLSYGAKTIPEGGWYSVPELVVPGGLLIGDSAGFLSVMTLKGIHLGMLSGMYAAEAAYEALRSGDSSAETLGVYARRVREGPIRKTLWKERHFRRAFTGGMATGFLKLPLLTLFGGRSRDGRGKVHPDWRTVGDRARYGDPEARRAQADPEVWVDKLTDVHLSGTRHREDQPSHIQVLDQEACFTSCVPAHGIAPCTCFCPAAVYDHVREEAGGQVRQRIQVNFSNCVHCKTCEILDPCDTEAGDGIQNIRWRVPPEGGPRYVDL